MDWKILSPLLMLLQGDCSSESDAPDPEDEKTEVSATPSTGADKRTHVNGLPFRVGASSFHGPVGHRSNAASRPYYHEFEPDKLKDGDLETCWQTDNKYTRGAGESVYVYFEEAFDLTEIRLANGCQDYVSNGGWGNLFERNPRVQRLKIESDTGQTAYWNLRTSQGGFQTKYVDMKDVSILTLTILEVSEKTDFPDASISELGFSGKK